jgi:hypothetical protein
MGAKHFLIQGGLHGNETLTTHFVNWLMHRVRSGQSPLNRLPAGSVIDFLPKANPDAYGQSRYNANQVNLNRNFGVLWGLSTEPHGEKPFSEPETKALKDLMERRRYLAAVDVHGYTNWIVVPSPPELLSQRTHHLGRLYHKWHKTVEQHAKLLPNYKVKQAGLLGDGGAFEDWAFWSNQTLSLCLEMMADQRFVPVEETTGARKHIDSFHRYEKFIATMFHQALHLKTRRLASSDTKPPHPKQAKTPPKVSH